MHTYFLHKYFFSQKKNLQNLEIHTYKFCESTFGINFHILCAVAKYFEQIHWDSYEKITFLKKHEFVILVLNHKVFIVLLVFNE